MMRNYDLTGFDQFGEVPFHLETTVLDRDFTVHTHSFIELVIILAGQGIHLVGQREFDLKAGDVFVVSGYLAHGFKNCRQLQLCNIMFDRRIFQPVSGELKKLAGFQSLFILEPYYRKQHDFKSRLILDPAGLEHVKAMISLMLQEAGQDPGSQDSPASPRDPGIALKMHFLSLTAFLCRQYTGDRNSFTRELYNLAATVSYMENNFVKSIKISELAARAHLSERHFSRVFSQNYHLSPLEYILYLRLQQGGWLLKNTDWPISRIALECGFYDTSAFTRQFKTRFHVTPKVYRRQGAPEITPAFSGGSHSRIMPAD